MQADDPRFETVRRELQRIEPMSKSAVQTVLEKISCDNTADDGSANTRKLKEDLARVQTGIEGALAFGIGDTEQISNMKVKQRVLKTRVAVRACDEQLGTLDRETPVPKMRAAILMAKSAATEADGVSRSSSTALSSEMASLAEQLSRIEPIAVEAAGERLEPILSESMADEKLSLRELEASRAKIRAALEDAETLGVDGADTFDNSRRLLKRIETFIAQGNQLLEQGVWDTDNNATQHTVIGKPRFMPLLFEAAHGDIERRHLMPVAHIRGVTYYSGRGAGWEVPQHSPLLTYAAKYDLDKLTAVFDGTRDEPLGKAVGLQGPNTSDLPYTFTIDMGKVISFSHWRVAGHNHYRFGKAHLEYENDATGNRFLPISGSEADYGTACDTDGFDGFAYGAFQAPVAARRWRICITTYATDHLQARFQCYLTEAQFGYAEVGGGE
jgi:hypothetical protein